MRAEPDPRICDAIRTRRLLMFGYGDAVRIVEPHLYGASAAGHELLSAWMRPGQSRVDPHGGWRSFRVDAMRELQILPEHFAAARPGYNPHDEHVPTVFCRLEPEPAAPSDMPPSGTPTAEDAP